MTALETMAAFVADGIRSQVPASTYSASYNTSCRCRLSERQFNRTPPRCHDLLPRSISGTNPLYRSPKIEMNPPVMTTFKLSWNRSSRA
jgi:hypothetical protein